MVTSCERICTCTDNRDDNGGLFGVTRSIGAGSALTVRCAKGLATERYQADQHRPRIIAAKEGMVGKSFDLAMLKKMLLAVAAGLALVGCVAESPIQTV